MPGSDQPAVRTERLVKAYGATRVLDGLDLEVAAGQVLGLLGPNGAGKTTTVRILTTLMRPDAGRAWVAGHDVVAEPHAVRRRIGASGQYAAVDHNLTGYQNLYLVGRCYGLSRSAAGSRARDLLADFGLADVAARTAKTYSGGMRRRLDLAAALIGRPAVVVLDEPTTGLDPRGRADTWAMVGELAARGTAVLLTTQYLEEADRLADTIVLLDHGRTVERGTPAALKARAGGQRLELTVAGPAEARVAAQVLAAVGAGTPTFDAAGQVSVSVDAGPKALIEALQRLEDGGVAVVGAGLRGPTLDEVFLTLTAGAGR